jgi:DNA-binding transcriptional LysR family regulator
LSRHVRRLEQRLGVELLARTTRSVNLTDAGRAFLERARETLAAANGAVDAARQAAAGQVGVLRVGMMAQIAADLRARALTVFGERYPDVELRPTGGYPYVEPTCGLASGETDVAFVWPVWEHPLIDAAVLFDEPRWFVLATWHPLTTRKVLTLEDVEDEPFFGFPPEYDDDPIAGAYRDFCQLQPRPDGRRRPEGARVTNRDEWIDALSRGLAISTTPDSSVTRTLAGWPGITCVRATGIEPIPVAIAWRSDRPNPIVSNFVDVVTELRRAEPCLR